ncbi:MAG: chemotaxis-specific protein-glutamate methyltransferase CheB [Undibacterium sp.]|nr:chemotaxis-specific protein-glutamate methyltransferase CheB [Opitutaceae bacterium]
MRIAIVNDLALATEAIRRVLATAAAHQLAWTARDGAEAVRRCAEDRPDLILMDLIMPVMDGVEATRRIMAATPCAILVVTATVDGNFGRVYDALGAGALDAVNTPTLMGPGGTAGAAALLAKIDILGRITGAGTTPLFPGATRPAVVASVPPAPTAGAGRWLFAIGCSAGGPAALAELLKTFPAEFPAAFVVIQHLDESFAAGLADWLGGQIKLPVRIARNDDAPEAGVVLLPGRDDHLVLTPAGRLTYTREPVNDPYRPSVDAFFESVARHWRARAAGVILTGMGRDGARGLMLLRTGGYPTIAQDRASSAVYGMPKAAAEAGAAMQILPLGSIGSALRQLL